MKVRIKDLDKQLRLRGVFAKMFIRFRDEKSLRLASIASAKLNRGKNIKGIDCSELFIATKNNAKLRLRIYRPRSIQPNATGVLWLHGGGFALSNPEISSKYYELLLQTANCVIVAPDYRLSTDAPFPAAFDDCYDTLLWLKDNAAMLGINASQLFVCGESAGGGLTAAVTLAARDRKEVNIAFAMPLYPMLDDRMDSASMKDNNAPLWCEQHNNIAWQLYAGDNFGTDKLSKYCSPSRETDYSNLPPMYTFVGDVEPFCDEVVTFVQNLERAGVAAEIDVYKGCSHAFDTLNPHANVSKTATEKMLRTFKNATINYYKEQPLK